MMISAKEAQAAVIPAEEAGAFEAWQMPAIQLGRHVVSTAGHTEQHSRKGRRQPPITASKIEAMEQQARDQAVKAGHAEGYAAGLAQAKAEMEQTRARFNSLMGHLMHPLAEQQDELEQALLQLVRQVASSVVRQTVRFNEEALLSIIQQAMQALPAGSEKIRLMVNPADVDPIRRALGIQAESWQIIADPAISSGGCVVRSEHSYIDYTLERQFAMRIDDMVRRQFRQTVETPLDVPSFTGHNRPPGDNET